MSYAYALGNAPPFWMLFKSQFCESDWNPKSYSKNGIGSQADVWLRLDEYVIMDFLLFKYKLL